MRNLALPVLCLVGLACEPMPFELHDLNRPGIAHLVAPGLSHEVDSEGRFISALPEAPPFEIISEETAAAYAEAYARTFGPFFGNELRRALGAPVPFEELSAAAIFLAQTPYEPFHADDAHPASARRLGPHYIVLLGNGQGIWVSVAVSALNHQLRLVDDKLVFPVHQGEEFLIAPFTGGVLIESAEQAVQRVAEPGGALVAQRPMLLLPERFGPESRAVQHARWQIVLDRPVRVRLADGAERDEQRVYVGNQGRLFAADTEQPQGETYTYVVLDEQGGFGGTASVPMQRVTDRPVQFVEVTRILR